MRLGSSLRLHAADAETEALVETALFSAYPAVVNPHRQANISTSITDLPIHPGVLLVEIVPPFERK